MRHLCIPAVALACMVAGLGLAGLAAGQEAPRTDPFSEPAFGASLSTNKPAYGAGEPIRITFEVFNRTPTAVRLKFASAQRFDFVIANAAGNEVWRWSAGRMFATVMGQETLGPDSPRLVYEATFAGELAPGAYRIKAWLTDGTRRFSAALGIEVR